MKQEETIWVRNQEYQILVVENPSPKEESEEAEANGCYVIEDRKLRWEDRKSTRLNSSHP